MVVAGVSFPPVSSESASLPKRHSDDIVINTTREERDEKKNGASFDLVLERQYTRLLRGVTATKMTRLRLDYFRPLVAKLPLSLVFDSSHPFPFDLQDSLLPPLKLPCFDSSKPYPPSTTGWPELIRPASGLTPTRRPGRWKEVRKEKQK